MLVALGVPAITTNYDLCYERAAQSGGIPVVRSPWEVGRYKEDMASSANVMKAMELKRQANGEGQPCMEDLRELGEHVVRHMASDPRHLLKLHGCAERPETIVLTREGLRARVLTARSHGGGASLRIAVHVAPLQSGLGADYMRYEDNKRALRGAVQTGLLDKHLLFVGFSMTGVPLGFEPQSCAHAHRLTGVQIPVWPDDNVHVMIDQVRKQLYVNGDEADGLMGTIFTMTENMMFRELWERNFSVVAMGDSWDDNPAWIHDCSERQHPPARHRSHAAPIGSISISMPQRAALMCATTFGARQCSTCSQASRPVVRRASSPF